jgi:hypothetical protein
MVPSSSQEVAVLLPLMISLATTLTTIVVHGVVLAAIVRFVLHEHRLGRTGVHFWRDVGIVACATLLALTAHLLEITVWAGALESCGEFTRFAAAFYHSAMNYTSLGYGDVVMSASWKLLGPLETANAMLMFGVSTGMIFTVIQRLFQTKYGEPSVASTPLPPADRAAA